MTVSAAWPSPTAPTCWWAATPCWPTGGRRISQRGSAITRRISTTAPGFNPLCDTTRFTWFPSVSSFRSNARSRHHRRGKGGGERFETRSGSAGDVLHPVCRRFCADLRGRDVRNDPDHDREDDEESTRRVPITSYTRFAHESNDAFGIARLGR